ncbi:MAG: class I SAM-dependent methyltransferase [Acidobacteriota bacterium]
MIEGGAAAGDGRGRLTAARTSLGRWLPALTAALLLAACSSSVRSGEGDGEAGGESVYSSRKPSRGGTGKVYMGREISQYLSYHGIPWLERDDRLESEKPDEVVARLGLKPDDVVADIGAGSGYFTYRLARKVPRGRVLAVDIQPEMLEAIGKRRDSLQLTNIEPVLGRVDDPSLPASEVDLVLMVDAYHEFSYPKEMAEGIVRSLAPAGRVVLVEYRGEDSFSSIHPLHRMTQAQIKREMGAVGLEWQETLDFLPGQHVMFFTRR